MFHSQHQPGNAARFYRQTSSRGHRSRRLPTGSGHVNVLAVRASGCHSRQRIVQQLTACMSKRPAMFSKVRDIIRAQGHVGTCVSGHRVCLSTRSSSAPLLMSPSATLASPPRISSGATGSDRVAGVDCNRAMAPLATADRGTPIPRATERDLQEKAALLRKQRVIRAWP